MGRSYVRSSSVKRVVYIVQSALCNVQCEMCSGCTRQGVPCSVQCVKCEIKSDFF